MNSERVPSALSTSSVTNTMNARMFISMSPSRPASVAAFRTISTFRSTAAAVIESNVDASTAPDVIVPLIPMMSASRAANVSTRRPPPPISTGGGVCTGLGEPSYSLIW